MNKLRPNLQMVECDDQTAELHMAMAEMMEEDEGGNSREQEQGEQLNVMENTYGQAGAELCHT